MPGSEIYFKKANGFEIVGTFVINPIDSSILTVSLDTEMQREQGIESIF